MFNHRKTKREALKAPNIPEGLPDTAQWLAGEGAGSWFVIIPETEKLRVHRYSPEGKLECSGHFREKKPGLFNIEEAFTVDYMSHCSKVTLRQKDSSFIFFNVEFMEDL